MAGQKRLLVLGATGIIGSWVCREASSQGWAVLAVSRKPPTVPLGAGVRHVAVDVRDAKQSEALADLSEFDGVVDLLSFTPEQLKRSLNSLVKRTKHYIFVSSATVTGGAVNGTPVTEDSPFDDGTWSYVRNKVASEALVRFASSEFPHVTTVRPYITYSEQRLPFAVWEGDQAMARFTGRRPLLLPDRVASSMTSVTHARDVAAAILLLIGNEKAYGATVQVVSPESRSWLELCCLTARSRGDAVNIRIISNEQFGNNWPRLRGKMGDRSVDRIFSPAKLRELLGSFEFEYSTLDAFLDIARNWSLSSSGFSARNIGRYERLCEASWLDTWRAWRHPAPRHETLGLVKLGAGRLGAPEWKKKVVGVGDYGV